MHSDADEIRSKLCPKNTSKDPMFCMDCKSFRSCEAGQTAVVQMDKKAVEDASESMLSPTFDETRVVANALQKKYLEQVSEEERLIGTRENLLKAIGRVDDKLEAIHRMKAALETASSMFTH